MTIDEAARILLRGVSGPNISEIARGAGVLRNSVERFLNGGRDKHEEIYGYVWRQLNAHLLITSADVSRRPCGARDKRVWIAEGKGVEVLNVERQGADRILAAAGDDS